MTDGRPPQLGSSKLVEHLPIELTYPQIPVAASYLDLLSRSSSTNMANGSQPDHQDAALSESWATLSDADYCYDDDLHSETTDAASLVSNIGPDDVNSIDDQPSDAGSQDAGSDKGMSDGLPPQMSLAESTRTVGAENVAALKGSHLERSIALGQAESQLEEDFAEGAQTIHSLTKEEAANSIEYGWNADEHGQVVGSVCMTMSKSNLHLNRPFRLLYCGNTMARAEILTKIGDTLLAGPEPQQDLRPFESSRYNVILPSDTSETSSNHSDLVRIRTQIIVDDCTTAASIKHEQAPDQIFLSFKNGSLYSSRWNGINYEVSSASEWSKPDLAVFFITHEDDPVSKQRYHLAHAFVSRHEVPSLIISDSARWALRFDDLPLDPCTPHLRVEAHKRHTSGIPLTLRRLPIDLETFKCLEPDQLNKNFAYLCRHPNNEIKVNTSSKASASSHSSCDKSLPSSKEADNQNLSKQPTLYPWYTNTPLLRTTLLAAGFLISLVMSAVACKAALALFVYLISRAGITSELSPATTWSLQPSLAPTVTEKALPVLPTGGAEVITSNKAISKSLAMVETPSDLVELFASKSLQATNISDNFQVHSIGDCHIVVKTPRGFKVRNKSAPFDVIVARGSELLNTSISRLFEGVYTVRVDRVDAYGLVNVTIRRHKSSTVEEHQVDFGAHWLKVAEWKKAAQLAREQVRSDLETAQTALLAAYDHLSEDMHFKAQDLSKKASKQAKKFSQQSRIFLNTTAKILRAKSKKLRHGTNHERQEAYKALSERVDLAFQALLIHAHTTNEQSRAIIQRILQAVEQIHLSTSQIELEDVQIRMQKYMRSEKLAKAQERAKQMVKDATTSWRQRRAHRKASRAGCMKRGRGRSR